MEFIRKGESDKELVDLYKALLMPRLIEEKMLVLLRQGKVSKWFSGYGQEAISVGLTTALHQDEYILPMHRNLGVFYCTSCFIAEIIQPVPGQGRWFFQRARPLFPFWFE